MINEELKQEAIKKAYGFGYRGDKINELGWFIMKNTESDKPNHNGFSDCDVDIAAFAWRPKSLRGLETNNGWIKIEQDGSNLPKFGYYWVKNSENGEMYNSTIDPNRREAMVEYFSHYQPIIKPEPPIY